MLRGAGVTIMTPKSPKDTQPCAESPRFHVCLPGTGPTEGLRVVLNRLFKQKREKESGPSHINYSASLDVWRHK